MRGRVLAVAALITYNSWLAWGLNGHPEALFGYVSELAAQDQPYQWFFRLADVLASGVFTIIALLGRQGWRPWLGRRAGHVAIALLVVAAGTVLDVIFNLPCAESRDAVCAATPSVTRHLHEAASVVVSVALVAVIGLAAWGMSERSGWTARARLTAGLAGLVGTLMVASVFSPYVAPGTQGPIQVLQVVLCSGWIAILAWRLPGGRRA